MDTHKDKSIIVTFEDGKVFKFNPYSNGLFYFDTENFVVNNISKTSLNAYSIVQTVYSNKVFSL